MALSRRLYDYRASWGRPLISVTTYFANSPLKKRVILFTALALILGVYTIVVVIYLRPRAAISNLDFWYHLSIGTQLRWDDPKTLSNGLYPLGYPLLLHLAIKAGIDILYFGKFLSWGGGLLLLSACFSLTYSLTRHLIFTIAGTLLLLLNIHFLANATYEGNDMLSAGFQAAAIVMLWYGTTSEEPRSISKPLLVLSGILLGFAYLARYSALILLPISIIYLIVQYRRSPRHMLKASAMVIIPFLVITSVQLIPSWRVHHNLFYNEQAKNVWFGIYGEQDWVNNWGKVPDTVGLTEVIAIGPARFFRHWLHELRLAFSSLRLWPLPFHIVWILALPILILDRQLAFSRRLLLLMLFLIPLAITAFAWVAPRFLLVSLWVEAILIAWLAFRLTSIVPSDEKISLKIVGGILIIAAIILHWRGTANWLSAPPMTRPQEVNEFLRMAGMKDAERTATNDPYLHAVDESTRTRYEQTYFINPNPNAVEDLLTHPSAADWQYLVMDYQDGFGKYAPLRDAFRQAKSHLVPLMLSERRDIFCIMPCSSNEIQPLNINFDNGMQLTGYRWQGSKREGILYLYWKTESELLHSFKVSVRVIDASGHEIMQIDNIPQLWTFPTTAWSTHTPVIDFYSWELGFECEDCKISLLVYEESSLEPLLATVETGQRVGPLIELRPLSNPKMNE